MSSDSDSDFESNDIFDNTYDDILNITKRNKNKNKNKSFKHKLPKDLQSKLKTAEMLYIQNDLTHAKELLTELIRLVPSYPSPYVSLSLIEEQAGNIKESHELIYMAAKLSKKDINLWNQVYATAANEKDIDRIIESLTYITQLDEKDNDSLFVLGKLLNEKGNYKKAGDLYKKILQRLPGNLYAIYNACDNYQKCNKTNEAIHLIEDNSKILLTQLKETYESDSAEFLIENKRNDILSIIKVLCNLYVDNKRFVDCIKIIEECNKNSSSPLPLDLAIPYGISKLNVNDINDV